MEDKEPRIRKQKVVLVNGKIIYKNAACPASVPQMKVSCKANEHLKFLLKRFIEHTLLNCKQGEKEVLETLYKNCCPIER